MKYQHVCSPSSRTIIICFMIIIQSLDLLLLQVPLLVIPSSLITTSIRAPGVQAFHVTTTTGGSTMRHLRPQQHPNMHSSFLELASKTSSRTSTTTTKSKSTSTSTSTSTELNGMKRPIIDQIASTIFKLEQSRVESSSIVDEKGRYGEPMEWSEKNSLANRVSEFIASNSLGYLMKQFIADLIAGGDYDQDATREEITTFVGNDLSSTGTNTSNSNSNSSSSGKKVAMYSFTSCPFCRQAKDYFEENGIDYAVVELDELEGNKGNEIRAMLGKLTKRTSVPSIFINGSPIGGLNDGMPGLMPLVQSGELKTMLSSSS